MQLRVDGRCKQAVDALNKCRKQHKQSSDVRDCMPCRILTSQSVQTQIVCKRPESVLAWCLMSAACPSEAAAIEACAGAQPYGGLPPAIPPRCAGQLMELQLCLERQQNAPLHTDESQL